MKYITTAVLHDGNHVTCDGEETDKTLEEMDYSMQAVLTEQPSIRMVRDNQRYYIPCMNINYLVTQIKENNG